MLSAVKLISSFVGKGFSSKAEESADVSKKTCPQYNGGVIKHIRGVELKVLLNTSQDVDQQKKERKIH